MSISCRHQGYVIELGLVYCDGSRRTKFLKSVARAYTRDEMWCVSEYDEDKYPREFSVPLMHVAYAYHEWVEDLRDST